MGNPQKKSCYVVEMSVGPGGSRWAELHAYTELAHVRWAIDRLCQNDCGTAAYHAISYGATVGIWTIQRGEVAAFLDLHPFIAAELEGKPAAKLSDHDGCMRILVERRKELSREDGDDEDEEELEEEEILDIDLEIYEEMALTADWEAIASRLPPLEEPLLGPGERACQDNPRGIPEPHEGTYFYLDENIRFGSYDVENGDVLDGPVPFESLCSDPDDEDEDEGDDEAD